MTYYHSLSHGRLHRDSVIVRYNPFHKPPTDCRKEFRIRAFEEESALFTANHNVITLGIAVSFVQRLTGTNSAYFIDREAPAIRPSDGSRIGKSCFVELRHHFDINSFYRSSHDSSSAMARPNLKYKLRTFSGPVMRILPTYWATQEKKVLLTVAGIRAEKCSSSMTYASKFYLP